MVLDMLPERDLTPSLVSDEEEAQRYNPSATLSQKDGQLPRPGLTVEVTMAHLKRRNPRKKPPWKT